MKIADNYFKYKSLKIALFHYIPRLSHKNVTNFGGKLWKKQRSQLAKGWIVNNQTIKLG